MKKLCILALFFVSLSSCSTYTIARYEVENILAVTKDGDTVQVPLSHIRNNYGYNYYNDWQFYYGTNWYSWNHLNFRYPYYSGFYRNFRYYSNPIYYYRSPIYYNRHKETKYRQKIKVRGSRYETNNNYPRSTQPTQTRSDGRRSRSGEVLSSQSTRPRVSTPSQPRQIRGGSQQPRIQQTQPRSRSSQQGSRGSG